MAGLMIITHSDDRDRAILALAGRITDNEIPALERAVAANAGHVTLDLAELRFANDLGIRTLRRLRKQGVDLMNATQLIRLLLDGSTAGAADDAPPAAAPVS